jgi:hypothetical protein
MASNSEAEIGGFSIPGKRNLFDGYVPERLLSSRQPCGT